MTKSKNILVAPLNWGLGHATRCIPIINKLIEKGYTPILASDGDALALLKKEFPDLEYHELPSYKIRYAKKGRFFKYKLLLHMPQLISAVLKETKQVKQLAQQLNLSGIISDNRLGVYHYTIPSVYITHQQTVLSGNSTAFTSHLHRNVIAKYYECWVPDLSGSDNFSGLLGHPKTAIPNTKYIGILSRFKKIAVTQTYDYLVLLSGPEPQRSILEQKLLNEFKSCEKNILFIQGIIKSEQTVTVKQNMMIYNFMTSHQLEEAINKSKLVIARSGYTTIMDLAKIGKKAFFIPTPGQFEQLYLAKKMKESNYAPYALQDEFSLKNLNDIETYDGLSVKNHQVDYDDLFSVFN